MQDSGITTKTLEITGTSSLGNGRKGLAFLMGGNLIEQSWEIKIDEKRFKGQRAYKSLELMSLNDEKSAR